MDRFVWTSGLLEINETLVIQQRGVRVYDGEDKVGRPPLGPWLRKLRAARGDGAGTGTGTGTGTGRLPGLALRPRGLQPWPGPRPPALPPGSLPGGRARRLPPRLRVLPRRPAPPARPCAPGAMQASGRAPLACF